MTLLATFFAFSVPQTMYVIYGYAVPLVIFAAVFGFRWKVGMWGNFISLGAVLFSALVAFGWWEDVAEQIAKLHPPILFLADCLAIWLLFLITLLVIDGATRFMSKVKVKYNDTIENVGNGIALFLLCTALFQFHLFANGHFGMVGEHYDKEFSSGAATNITANLLGILSTGNLAGFTRQQEFDEKGDNNLLKLHHQRRQAIMHGWQPEDGTMQAKEDMFGKMNRGR